MYTKKIVTKLRLKVTAVSRTDHAGENFNLVIYLD